MSLEGSHSNQICTHLEKYCQKSKLSTGKETSELVLVSQTNISIFSFLSVISEYNMTMTFGVAQECL